MANHFQAGRLRVLAVLHDPHPAAFIEIQEHRLGDNRLGEHLLEFQVVGYMERFERFGRAQRHRACRSFIRGFLAKRLCRFVFRFCGETSNPEERHEQPNQKTSNPSLIHLLHFYFDRRAVCQCYRAFTTDL